MANFVDLTGETFNNSTALHPVDLCDDSTDEGDLDTLFNPLAPLPNQVRNNEEVVDLTLGSTSSSEYSTDDDSSLGMENSHLFTI